MKFNCIFILIFIILNIFNNNYIIVGVNSSTTTSSTTSSTSSTTSSTQSTTTSPTNPTSSPSTIPNQVIINVYNDSLGSSFMIPGEFTDNKVYQVKSPLHSGNSSIGFLSDFYIFCKSNQVQNITINKQVFSSLKLWVYPSSHQQDITISLITGDKEIHAIPIINQINQINSVSRSSYLQMGKWNEITIDLEYFPSVDYRAIWFLQRHPNSSIFIDDISLTARATPRNRRILYKGGVQGYGVIISEEKGVKLYQNVKTFKKSPYSIVFNMKKTRSFSIDFQSKFEVLNNEFDFVFHILSKKKLPTNGDLMISFLPIHPLDNIPRFNLTGSKIKSPCQVVSLPENKWVKCIVRIPQQIEFRRISLSFSNPNITTSTHLFLDSIYLQSNVVGSPKLTNSLLDSYKDSQILENISISNKIINKIENEQTQQQQSDKVINNSNNIGGSILLGDKVENLGDIELLDNNFKFQPIAAVQQTNQQNNNKVEKEMLLIPQYFGFEQINPVFVTSVGQTLKWGIGLPEITFKSPNQRSIIKPSKLTYDDDFNSPDFVSIVGNVNPVKILSMSGNTRNEFKFLNMNFSFPFNNFYLIVSIDPYEEVWISASRPNGTVTNNWSIIKNGFLTSNNVANNNGPPDSLRSPAFQFPTVANPEFMKTDNINDIIIDSITGVSPNPIKTKIKGDQGFYLKAGKTSDINAPSNFIILKQNDIISAISFSMVSDRTTSSFFYALLANPTSSDDQSITNNFDSQSR